MIRFRRRARTESFAYEFIMEDTVPVIQAAFAEVDAWCRERFGCPPLRWFGSNSISVAVFFFREDDDALEFRLRWC